MIGILWRLSVYILEAKLISPMFPRSYDCCSFVAHQACDSWAHTHTPAHTHTLRPENATYIYFVSEEFSCKVHVSYETDASGFYFRNLRETCSLVVPTRQIGLEILSWRVHLSYMTHELTFLEGTCSRLKRTLSWIPPLKMTLRYSHTYRISMRWHGRGYTAAMLIVGFLWGKLEVKLEETLLTYIKTTMWVWWT